MSRKTKQSYDKNQGYQEKLNLDIRKSRSPRKKLKIAIKIKVFKKNLNKVMTKIEVLKKKIEGSYDKNQGCLEKKVFKLNKGMKKKSNFLKEKLRN